MKVRINIYLKFFTGIIIVALFSLLVISFYNRENRFSTSLKQIEPKIIWQQTELSLQKINYSASSYTGIYKLVKKTTSKIFPSSFLWSEFVTFQNINYIQIVNRGITRYPYTPIINRNISIYSSGLI
jgi:hypothetical protein